MWRPRPIRSLSPADHAHRIPSVFSTPSPKLPKFLKEGRFHSLASGVCFVVPFVRQLWWGLGLRPATRATMTSILESKGGSVLLCPGGVQECLLMTTQDEVVFLKKRHVRNRSGSCLWTASSHLSELCKCISIGRVKDCLINQALLI